MRRIFFYALVALSLAGFSSAQVRPEIKQEQHKATLTIIMIGSSGRAGCSATAVSEHVLLTAEHCNVAGGSLYLNQTEKPFSNPLEVTEKYFDHNDHMLMVVPGVIFRHVVAYDPLKYRPAEMGEYVYLWGNPALMQDQYREGYATGVVLFPKNETEDIDAAGAITMFSMPIVGGDSGSAVFSATNGSLIGVTTYGIASGKFMGSYPLCFTAEQVAQAEGRGNFVYLPNTKPVTKLTVFNAPDVNASAMPGQVKTLSKLFALFIALYACALFCKAAGTLTRSAVYVWRKAKSTVDAAKQFIRRVRKCRSQK